MSIYLVIPVWICIAVGVNTLFIDRRYEADTFEQDHTGVETSINDTDHLEVLREEIGEEEDTNGTRKKFIIRL